MIENRVFNFSAGPSCLPYEVLKQVEEDLYNHKQSGMSVMEMSHRSKEFKHVLDESIFTLREILELPNHYKMFFMHGGGTLQFASVPLNLLKDQGAAASYAITGQWSQKAFEECKKFGKPQIACNGSYSNFTTIPTLSNWLVPQQTSYLFYCHNETISGLEFAETPQFEGVKIIGDLSSSLCSRPIDLSKHQLVFASAQKNLGPAGATLVIADQNILGKPLSICPSVCDYTLQAKNDSLYNTPCCWSIYVIGLMAKFIKQKGGLDHWGELNAHKAKLLYNTIDESDGFYNCLIDKKYRSNMNVTFNILNGDEKLENLFLHSAEKMSYKNLLGHRSIGGFRASIYNGFPLDGVLGLTEFMKEFQMNYYSTQ